MSLRPQPDREFVLTLSCPDRSGLVHAVSGFLVRHSGNIRESQQFDDRLQDRFFMRVHFDVSDPAKPSRLDNLVRRHAPSESAIDPHAFLYWPATRTAVIPIDSWNPGQSGAALVVRVDADNLSVLGTLRNPALSTEGYDTGIERTLVIGHDIWTMSSSGLLVSDLQSLARRGWVAFS